MRSVAKGNYIKGAGGIKHALAHVRYLQTRDGEDRDCIVGKKRLFINHDRSAISGTEVNELIKKQNENRVVIHRIVLSPGLQDVDMEAYTRSVMRELSGSKGQDLIYYATEHKNTDHAHTHVVIMGRDKYNREVRLNRNNYKTVRDAGDRYLERYHYFSRYLDKEQQTLMRDGYKHDRGDQSYEWLLQDLKSSDSLDECYDKRWGIPEEFSRELAIHALPDEERIVRGGTVFTKYSPLNDLLDLDARLVSNKVDPVPKEQYKKLWSWIGNKKQFGDDYYERKAEADRLHRLFDEELKQSLRTDNSPPKSYRQYIFESRGRLLEWHEKYQINVQRHELQKHIETLDQSGEADPERRKGLIDQLDWLDQLVDERIQSRQPIPRIPRARENKKEMENTISQDNANNPVSENPDKQNQILNKEQTEQERLEEDREQQERLEHRQQAQGEQERIDHLEHINDRQHSEQPHQQQNNQHQSGSKEEQSHQGESHQSETRESENLARERFQNDEQLRQIDQSHNIDEERSRASERLRLETENTYKHHRELERLRLFLDDTSQNYPDGVASRLQRIIDSVTEEIKHKHHQVEEHFDDHGRPLDLVKNIDPNQKDPNSIDQLKQGFDSDRDTSTDHSQTNQNTNNQSTTVQSTNNQSTNDHNMYEHNLDINEMIFGDDPPIPVTEFENSQTDAQFDNWEKAPQHDLSQEEHQQLDRIMQEDVHETMRMQIQRTFMEHEQQIDGKADIAQAKEEKEQERDDDHGDRTR